MGFSRSESSFFYREETTQFIEELAREHSLVVYAGAGVSIDRSGMSWTDLIHNLLTHIEGTAAGKTDQQRAIMKANTPLQAASIASQRYRNKYGTEWQDRIILHLRDVLYVKQKWQRGGLISSIVQLAATFRDRQQNLYIVTTNYDEFIQQAARDANGETALELETSVIEHGSSPEFTVDEHAKPLTVVHLHGYVPARRNDKEREDVIISELDYIRSQPRSTDVLTTLFEDNAVLIIGSSLTDPPLLEALARTESAAGRGKRVAVMPIQGFELPDDASLIPAVQESIKLRMQQFDTEVVFPDFFSQVPQLLTEVILRLRSEPGATVLDYEHRLETWWREWHEARKPRLRQRQFADHEFLERELECIKRKLGIGSETLKLEMWIRWDPDDHRRELALWASSTGSWPAMNSMRRARIEADSRHVSVRAHCLGRPEIYEHHDAGDRWRTYLCVPIRFGERGEELPVGVISMASMTVKDRSRISEPFGEALAGVVDRMVQAGIALATPRSPQGT